MRRRPIFALVCLLLLSTVGCKSGSANADEVLAERTKRSESSESTATSEDTDDEADSEDGANSESVIRLFDESEVDESDDGDIEIQNASESAVEVKIDRSDCETFERTMSASVDELDTSCESDDDCAMLKLPCAFGCSRPVANYVGLEEIERNGERYIEECPNCKKSCQAADARVAVCGDKGRCVARVLAESADDATVGESAEDDSGEGDEATDVPTEDSE